MIPHGQNREVTVSGFGEVKTMGMELTGKVFSMLMVGIYDRPIEAVLREYSVNAEDAQVEAGVSDPIEVHLPNRLEPYLEIKDKGIGMTKETVETVFCTVGRSTKEQSNAVTGCLGVGAKSGYALSDSFSVTTIKNGIKSVFILSKDTKNLPTYTQLGSSLPTDEHDGTAVRISVDNMNFYKFKEAAETVYRAFANKPVITGVDQINISSYSKDLVLSSGYLSRDKRISCKNGAVIAVQGNIAYPIRIDQLEDRELQEFFTTGFGTLLVLDFPIGSLDFKPSREELDYGETTVANLTSRAREFMVECKRHYSEAVKDTTGIWDYAKLAEEYYNVFHVSDIPNSPKGYVARKPIDFPHKVIKMSEPVGDEVREWTETSYDFTSVTYSLNYNDTLVKSTGAATSFRPHRLLENIDDVKVVFIDKRMGAISRIRHLLKTSSVETVIAITGNNESVNRNTVSKFFELDVDNTSELESPPRQISTASSGVFLFRQANRWENKVSASFPTAVEIGDMDPAGYYFEIVRFDPQGVSLDEVTAYREAAGRDIPIYAVRKSVANKIDSNMRHVSELKKEVDSLFSKELIDLIAKSKAPRSPENAAIYTFRKELSRFPLFRALNENLNAERRLSKMKKSNPAIQVVVNAVGKGIGSDEVQKAILERRRSARKLEEEIIKKAPLLRAFEDSWRLSDNKEALRGYIVSQFPTHFRSVSKNKAMLRKECPAYVQARKQKA